MVDVLFFSDVMAIYVSVLMLMNLLRKLDYSNFINFFNKSGQKHYNNFTNILPYPLL